LGEWLAPPSRALHHPGQASCNTEPVARIRNMLGGLTYGAGVVAVLIAIMGTVSAHATQEVSAVAASESAANQDAAHANALALLGEVSLPAGATESSSEPAGDGGLLAHAGAGGPDIPNVVEAHAYKFEDLTITRQVAADGKPNSGFVSYFRLNRALPFASRGKFEGEEEDGPRLFAAYLSVDHVHEEGATETMGDDASRRCYTEAIEVNAHEHQPRIGELVNVSLVIHGRAVINTRTRVRTRKTGRSVRKPNGVLLLQTDLPYEKAFGCLKMSS
jgi:hypothetical protein